MFQDNKYSFYVGDVETTGLVLGESEIIELSLIRLKDDVQKTWLIKPSNPSKIDMGALKVNGHKYEDLTHITKYGKENYIEPAKAIVEIENWLLEDNVSTLNRVLCGQNVAFDHNMMNFLWRSQNAADSFPFGRRTLDTMQIEFFLDLAKNSGMAEGYSLSNLTKKYNVKNEKAHSAAADTLATKEVLKKQVEFFSKILNK